MSQFVLGVIGVYSSKNATSRMTDKRLKIHTYGTVGTIKQLCGIWNVVLKVAVGVSGSM